MPNKKEMQLSQYRSSSTLSSVTSKAYKSDSSEKKNEIKLIEMCYYSDVGEMRVCVCVCSLHRFHRIRMFPRAGPNTITSYSSALKRKASNTETQKETHGIAHFSHTFLISFFAVLLCRQIEYIALEVALECFGGCSKICGRQTRAHNNSTNTKTHTKRKKR